MQTKHTPGPWHIGTHTYHAGRDVYGPKGEFVAVADQEITLPEESAANARLIAAAPELLAALQALTATARTFRNVPKKNQEWTPLDDDAINAAFIAIAKATGG